MQRRDDGPRGLAAGGSGGGSGGSVGPDEPQRSERACPVCGAHALALDVPPRIDVMGVQPYTDIIGMGDRPQQGPLGIVCRSCHTYWRDLAAFERGEPEPEVSEEGDAAEEEPR